MEQMAFICNKWQINDEKLMASILANQAFCDKLSIRIGTVMIEKMGKDSIANDDLSLAAMTWDAVEN